MNYLIATGGDPIWITGPEGQDGGAAQVTATIDQIDQVPAAEAGGAFNMTFLFGAYILIFFLMWLFMWRPQAKKRKAHIQMMQGLNIGDNIVTNGGLFGKITDIGEDVYLVEFGTIKGTKIPILKTEVAGVREPILHKQSQS